MANPKNRHSHSRRHKRRAHDGLSAVQTNVCPQCLETKLPHRICTNCGTYKGKTIIKGKEE